MRRAIAASVAAAFVLAAALDAQVRVVRYGDDRLAGITDVDVVVAVESAGGCTAPPEALGEAAASALRAAGIRATVSRTAPSWFYSVIVNVTTLAVGDGCVAVQRTELVADVHGIPTADQHLDRSRWGSLLVGPMTLIGDTVTMHVPRAALAGALDAAIRRQAAAMAARVRAATP